MVNNSYYSRSELEKLGFNVVGTNVFISRFSRFYGIEKIAIGNNVRIDDYCILSGSITLGSYVHIAPFCGLYGLKGIVLEDFAGLSSQVSIYTESDDYTGKGLTNPLIPARFRKIYSSIITIKKHALVGSGAVILPGGNLNEGSVLGSMSLLKNNTRDWHIYAGIPAKEIKAREKETINKYENELLNEANS